MASVFWAYQGRIFGVHLKIPKTITVIHYATLESEMVGKSFKIIPQYLDDAPTHSYAGVVEKFMEFPLF